MDVFLADEFHKGGELAMGQYCLDFHTRSLLESALDIVHAASAAKSADDILADFFIFFAYDADSLAFVQADGEIIYNEAVEPGSDEADYYQAEWIDEE